MSIASEIERLNNAKSSIKQSIINKGVNVPDTEKLDTYSTYVDQISGTCPTPETPSKIVFTGYTFPMVWTDATQEERTFVYESATHNINIAFENATITGNGTKIVTVLINEGLSTGAYAFSITCTNDEESLVYNGVILNFGSLADGEVCTMFKNANGGYFIYRGWPTFSKTTTSLQVTSSTKMYSYQVVGFTFGKWKPTSSDSTIPDDFLRYCYSFNQPIKVPNGVTKIGLNFLSSCHSFSQPVQLPNELEEIGDGFLATCVGFNHPINIPNVNIIGSSFLNQCHCFNQPITFSNDLRTIGDAFLQNCYSFNQPIVFPENDKITSIGSHFLSFCSSFNQPVTIDSGQLFKEIGEYFLYACSSFNKSLKISTDIKKVKLNTNYFLNSCSSFNQPLTVPLYTSKIGVSFMESCTSFNSPLAFSIKPTVIGNRFLYSCWSFNQPINDALSMVTSIGNYFMYGCDSFNQTIIIPSSVTSAGTYFMYNCYSLLAIVYNATKYPTGTNSLSQGTDSKTSTDGTGIKVTGTGASGLKSALANRTSSPYRKLV